MKETVSKIMTEVLKDSLKVGFTCNLQISDLNNRFPEKESILSLLRRWLVLDSKTL